MEQIRVATFAGPGAQPVIRSVPWPNIPNKAALIKIGASVSLRHRSAYPERPLAEETSLGLSLGPLKSAAFSR
jgi:hypothetical protein